MNTRVIALALAAALAACAPKAEFSQVLDGNTLQIKKKVIRLQGVDAPQLGQRCGTGPEAWKCGQAARDELLRLVGTAEVHCDILSRDSLNRAIARCTANGRDLGEALIAGGFAKLDPHHPPEYEALEAGARAGGLGLWAATSHAAAPGATATH